MLVVFGLPSFSQKSVKSFELELLKQFEEARKWQEHPVINDTVDSYDSLATVNIRILRQIAKFGTNNPAFLNYSFPSLSMYMDVVSSKDKKFRIYSWDTYTGGTMHEYYAIAQFLVSTGKVYTKFLTDTTGDIAGLWYSQIYTFKNKEKTYYFSIGNGKYSTMDLAQEVNVFTIEGIRLIAAPIIKTKNGLTSIIHVDYNLFLLTDKTDRSISFEESKKELKIPLVDEKGKMTTRNIVYKFNGTYFEWNSVE